MNEAVKLSLGNETSKYHLVVDFHSDRMISGWVKYIDSDEPILCEIWIEGILVEREIRCDRFRSDLRDAGHGNGCHGFVFNTPSRKKLSDNALVGNFKKQEFYLVTFKDIERNQIISTLDIPLYREDIGTIDAWRDGHLVGWCAKSRSDRGIAEFDLWLDDVCVARGIRPTIERPDVHKAMGTALVCGYAVKIDVVAMLSATQISLRARGSALTIASRATSLLAGLLSEYDANSPASYPLGGRFDPRDLGGSIVGTKNGNGLAVVIAVPAERRIAVYYTDPSCFRPPSGRVQRDDGNAALLAFEPVERAQDEVEPAKEGAISGQLYRASSPCLIGNGPIGLTIEAGRTKLRVENLPQDSRYSGKLERASESLLSGWAIDFANPGHAPEVEFRIDGIPFLRRECNFPRPDVMALYPSFPTAGFRVQCAIDSLVSLPTIVRVAFADTDCPLPLRAEFEISANLGASKRAGSRTTVAQRGFVPQRVGIVIPVYNAFDDLEACLSSVRRHTRLEENGHFVLLCDDASPDPRIGELLASHEGVNGFRVLRQSRNRGYTGNVNDGIRAARKAGAGDICLLNSDTRVTPQWLSLLQRTANQAPSVGTVTALSDNAGSFSVPRRNQSNPLVPWLREDDYARVITQNSPLRQPAVPTGSGFCMYIRAALFDDIGLFDEASYPRGYGEENDFCMRALHAGWENVVADNVLIYHERSKSFLESKDALMSRAAEAVPDAYPEYPVAVARSFASAKDMLDIRYSAGWQMLRSSPSPRPRIAFVIGVESGGTPQTNMDLMSRIQEDYQPWLLLCSTTSLRVFRIEGTRRYEIETIDLQEPVEPISHDSRSYRRVIADVLQRFAFEIVHIRHIGRHGLSLISMAQTLEIPVLFSLHDFYTICPNVKLLDAENRFCGGRCTDGEADCGLELWSTRPLPRLRGGWVRSWQKVFARILARCDALITTSPYARDLLRATYSLDNVPFHVIPHARDFDEFCNVGQLPQRGEPLRVFVPGHLVPAKGLDLIRAVKELDAQDAIEFHFAGMSAEGLATLGVHHGRYKREELPRIIAKIRPHLGAVLAIWPETYSHTLTEMWSCGLPVLVTALGAPGERIADHGGGWALEDLSPQAVLDALLSLRDDPLEVQDRRREVEIWQMSYGRSYNIEVMACRYKRLYARALHRPGDLVGPTLLDVAVINVGVPQANAGAASGGCDHLEDWLQTNLGSHSAIVWPASTLDVADRIEAPDVVVIRYHGSPGPGRPICDALAHWPEVRVFVELPVSLFHGSAHEIADKNSDLSNLMAKSEAIFAPDVAFGTCASLLDLEPIFVNSEEARRHGAERAQDETREQIEAIGLPGSRSISTSAMHADRLDREVMAGASAWVKRHNQELVDANFTLIDWRRELSRPRVPGRISIVVPTFRRVGITEAMIRSLLERTGHGDFEVILVDNGSPVETWRELRGVFRGIDPRLRLMRAPMPLMFAVGSNWGAAAATGDILVFMNNDMVVEDPDWLTALTAPFVSAPNVGICGARLLYEDRTVQHGGIEFPPQSNFPYHLHEGLPENAPEPQKTSDVPAVTGACLAIRASDWAKLRGFNPLYVNGCEDLDLCLRMQHVLARRVVYVGSSTVIHHEGKTPGRGRATFHNRMIFVGLWGERIADSRTSSIKPSAVNSFATVDTALREPYRSYRPTQARPA